MDFERVLEKCGNFNRYQLLLLGLFGCVNILSSFHYFSQTIISFTPEHWCHHEKLDNMTFDDIREIYSDFKQPSCTKLDDIIEGVGIESSETCKRWIYNYEYEYQSVSTEMNWVCAEGVNLAIGQSFFFVGSVLGTLFYGVLSDKIGRLPALILSNLSGCIGDVFTSYAGSLTTFALCRFVSGLATDTCFYLMYIMVFEYLRPSKRTFGLNFITGLFYCIGLVCVPWIAVLMGNWRKFLLVVSLPTALIITFAFILCESAQWLLTRKNYTAATKCLKRVAKFNGRDVDDSVFEEFEEYYTKLHAKTASVRTDTFPGMFRTPRLRKITIILFLKSMVITLSYDVVARNVEGLGTSAFILFSITSLAYVPSALTIIMLQNKVGRKGMAFGSMIMGGIFTTITGFIIALLDHESNAILLAIMAVVARYGTCVAYEAEAQYAAELIPTCVRGQGVAIVHVIGYALSFLSSYIIFLGTYYKPLPSIALSCILFVGAYLCLFLPETLNRKLPNSLAEGEEFGRDDKLLDFACIRRRSSVNLKDIKTSQITGEEKF